MSRNSATERLERDWTMHYIKLALISLAFLGGSAFAADQFTQANLAGHWVGTWNDAPDLAPPLLVYFDFNVASSGTLTGTYRVNDPSAPALTDLTGQLQLTDANAGSVQGSLVFDGYNFANMPFTLTIGGQNGEPFRLKYDSSV